MKILAIGGSIRSINPKVRKVLIQAIETAENKSQYCQIVDEENAKFRKPILSNSTIFAGVAPLGAKDLGAFRKTFSL